ncbi:CLUMA_CG010590, isoform A [Clunio marinus]|uniref:CLUMA_CG010590, isoform A n=1 Tax=Clunio marinus TaxID=568069 RepID=A0A1J1IFG2_9DIPT|nr:CLUMA_CG010590, isoform A [Clunio marinus]
MRHQLDVYYNHGPFHFKITTHNRFIVSKGNMLHIAIKVIDEQSGNVIKLVISLNNPPTQRARNQEVILIFCIIGLCTAAAPTKAKTNNKQSDGKEKRESGSSSGPYSYEAPQKSIQIQVPQHQQKAVVVEHYQTQHQPKVAAIEHYQAQPQKKVAAIEHYQTQPQKAASIDYYQESKQQPSPVHYQQSQQYHEYPQFKSSSEYPSSFGGLYSSDIAKEFSDYSYNYPTLEAFNHMPIVHYSPETNKINTAVVSLPGQSYKSPSYSSYKTASYQPSYSFSSPESSYSFPVHSYSYPQQEQHASYVSSYPSASFHSISSVPTSHYSFTQPAAYYVPQSVSIAPKPTKLPDYAVGTKGLSHYSTVAAVPLPEAHPTQSAVYIKQQQYEIPSYQQQPHSVQFTQTERPFKASSYLGSSHISHGDSHHEQSISSIKPTGDYHQSQPQKNYLPAKEQQHYVPQQTYIAPSKSYLPSKEQHQYVPEQSYLTPTKTYLPSKEQHYVPEQSPVTYQVQYVQAPAKSHIQPVAKNYLPSKAAQELPKSSYLPPKNSYIPPSQPTNNYLPPNNPYHSASHSSPVQYHPLPSFETSDYQSHSGHK